MLRASGRRFPYRPRGSALTRREPFTDKFRRALKPEKRLRFDELAARKRFHFWGNDLNTHPGNVRANSQPDWVIAKGGPSVYHDGVCFLKPATFVNRVAGFSFFYASC